MYYSLEGHTHKIAKQLSKEFQADTLRVKPKKDIPSKGFIRILMGLFALIKGKKTVLENIKINPNDYDMILIGTPVWFGRQAPAISSFLSKFTISNKKIAFFATSGDNPGVTFAKLEQLAPNNTIVGPLSLTSKEDDWAKKVSEWVKKINS